MAKIGIRLANGEFYPILDEDSTSRKALIVTTVKDNQPSVQIDVYRGEKSMPSDENTYVGSLVVENIDPQPKGIPDIRMELGLDEDGNLSAYARDEASGEHQTLKVSLKALEQEEIYEMPDFDITGDGELHTEEEIADVGLSTDEFPDLSAFDADIPELDSDFGADLGRPAQQDESAAGENEPSIPDFDISDFESEETQTEELSTEDFGPENAGNEEPFSMDLVEEEMTPLPGKEEEVFSFDEDIKPQQTIVDTSTVEKNTGTSIRKETHTTRETKVKTPAHEKSEAKTMPLWLKIVISVAGLLLILALAFLIFKCTADRVPAPPAVTQMESPKPEVAPAPAPVVAPAPAPVPEVAPAPAPAPVPAPAPEKKVKPTPAPRKPGVWYKIKWGDTLWDLSIAYYRTPWKYGKIYRANKIIKHPDRIIATTWIYIPK